MPNQPGAFPPSFRQGQELSTDEMQRLSKSVVRRIQGDGKTILARTFGDQVFISALPQRGVSAGGSSGTTIQLVQAQAAGASGSVSVKAVTLKSNLASSPNFEVSGAAFTVAYLKV